MEGIMFNNQQAFCVLCSYGLKKPWSWKKKQLNSGANRYPLQLMEAEYVLHVLINVALLNKEIALFFIFYAYFFQTFF